MLSPRKSLILFGKVQPYKLHNSICCEQRPAYGIINEGSEKEESLPDPTEYTALNLVTYLPIHHCDLLSPS